jgi:replicative DNA helicase Mcm
MMQQLSDESWTDLIKQFIEQHPDVKTALLGGERAVITDSELMKTSGMVEEVHVAGMQVLQACKFAVSSLMKDCAGELILTRSRGSMQMISDLRAEDVGRLVSVNGIVRSVSDPLPRATVAAWQCIRCGAVHHIEQTGVRKMKEPLECYKEGGGCGRAAASTKFRLIVVPSVWNGKPVEPTEHVDEQWLEIQDSPEDLEGESKPRSKLVRLLGDPLVDLVHQGDKVTVHGILDLDNEDNKLVAAPTFIDAHHIEVHNSIDIDITQEEEAKLRALAAGPDPLMNVIVPSIAPRIYGREEAKAALGTALFRGSVTDLLGNPVRDTIHVGLFGDPGTAKSVIIRFVAEMSPRGVFCDAKRMSAAGLTAGLVQHKAFGEGKWMIEAGALVLADKGICCIDEAGDLDDDGFTACNEAMEQQTVTTTKISSHLTLNARTSVVLAGNPKGGCKWQDIPIHDQVDIPASTLSRIDLFFIIKDDPKKDQDLRDHMNRYYGVGPAPPVAPLTPRELRQYVSLASRIEPMPTPEALARFGVYHSALRLDPQAPFTVRTYQGLIRIGGAIARTRLSDKITEEDALEAIKIHSAGWQFAVTPEGHFDIKVITAGTAHSQRERMRVILEVVDELAAGGRNAPLDDICAATAKRNITASETRLALSRMVQDGRLYEPTLDTYRAI